MKKLQQLFLLLACILVLAVAAVQRDGKLLGNRVFSNDNKETKTKIGRIQRANALHRKVIKSFRKNTQKEYKNLIFLLVED